jgi:hypothetical protein
MKIAVDASASYKQLSLMCRGDGNGQEGRSRPFVHAQQSPSKVIARGSRWWVFVRDRVNEGIPNSG